VVATRARARRAIIARAPWARRHAHGPHEPPQPERPPKFSTRFRAHSGTPKPITHRAKLRFRHRTDNGKPSHAVRTAFDPPYTCEPKVPAVATTVPPAHQPPLKPAAAATRAR